MGMGFVSVQLYVHQYVFPLINMFIWVLILEFRYFGKNHFYLINFEQQSRTSFQRLAVHRVFLRTQRCVN